MTVYERLADYLGGKSERPGFTSKRQTRIHRLDADTIAVRYHDTDVVTAHADGSVTLSSGGWLTLTTKARMNEYLEWATVYSERGEWRVASRGRRDGPDYYVYADGMTLHPDGSVTGARNSAEVERERRENKELDRLVRRYVDGLTDEGIAELARRDPSGDCWSCALVGNPSDTGHLRLHLEERYYMGSLLLNAVKGAGYNDPIFILNHTPDLVRDAVRHYFRNALYTGARVTTRGRRPVDAQSQRVGS